MVYLQYSLLVCVSAQACAMNGLDEMRHTGQIVSCMVQTGAQGKVGDRTGQGSQHSKIADMQVTATAQNFLLERTAAHGYISCHDAGFGILEMFDSSTGGCPSISSHTKTETGRLTPGHGLGCGVICRSSCISRRRTTSHTVYYARSSRIPRTHMRVTVR